MPNIAFGSDCNTRTVAIASYDARPVADPRRGRSRTRPRPCDRCAFSSRAPHGGPSNHSTKSTVSIRRRHSVGKPGSRHPIGFRPAGVAGHLRPCLSSGCEIDRALHVRGPPGVGRRSHVRSRILASVRFFETTRGRRWHSSRPERPARHDSSMPFWTAPGSMAAGANAATRPPPAEVDRPWSR